MLNCQLIHGDCLTEMQKLIEDDIKVDLVLTDIPYGTTACKWDTIIPFDEMWTNLHELTKPKTPILLFGTEPFSSHLRLSNLKNYKYDWIWEKEQGTGFQLVKYRPFMKTENISVFCKKTTNYYPIMKKMDKVQKVKRKKGSNNKSDSSPLAHSEERTSVYTHRYPVNILHFKRDRGLHPTQKPVKLLQYLIQTYTNKGDTILDFTMGSGSTGVACQECGRNFIGIELEKKYYDIAVERCRTYQSNLEAYL